MIFHLGIMTQCLRVDKIMEASEVYWRNVALKYVQCVLNSS